MKNLVDKYNQAIDTILQLVSFLFNLISFFNQKIEESLSHLTNVKREVVLVPEKCHLNCSGQNR